MSSEDLMQRYRFYLPELPFQDEELVVTGDIARQLFRVLRRRPGDPVGLFCGDGREHDCRLLSVGVSEARLHREGVREPAVELPGRLEVALSLLKADRLEWAAQKLTEVGVTRLVLLRAARTVALGESGTRLGRLRRVMVEAAEQSGRVRVPELAGPLGVDEVVAEFGAEPTAYIACEDASLPLARALASRRSRERIVVLVGPEGGFTPAEVAHTLACGVRPVSLGGRTLRAETAAVTAAVLAASTLEGGG
ncbi:MAG: 16S rRNA (uracil(1498)-N(3))-methyltransferase [Armatimonadetes bacterium]|nr:16S rRNA (uracil(1498)-N(3))-methyltransferase [Armatimonadota bacterium]